MIRILLISLLATTIGVQCFDICGNNCSTPENNKIFAKLSNNDQESLYSFMYMNVANNQDEQCTGLAQKYGIVVDDMLEFCRNFFEYVLQLQTDKLFRELLTRSFKY